MESAWTSITMHGSVDFTFPFVTQAPMPANIDPTMDLCARDSIWLDGSTQCGIRLPHTFACDQWWELKPRSFDLMSDAVSTQPCAPTLYVKQRACMKIVIQFSAHLKLLKCLTVDALRHV